MNMKPFTKALALFFLLACVGLGLLSVSRSRIEAGQHDLFAIGTGLAGIAVLGLAAVIYRGAMKLGIDN